MSGYVKLFGSILDSTVWELPLPAKVTWITMMAMADKDGMVSASVPGLAKRAGVLRSDCEKALATFLAPDPDSRTKDCDGRRIKEVDGGWVLINHEKYRELRTPEERRAKDAERQRRHRERHALSRSVTEVTSVAQNHRSDQHQIRSAPEEDQILKASVTVARSNGHTNGHAQNGAGAPAPSKLWAAHEWKTKYGYAWAEHYQQVAYGQPGDSKACGTLHDALQALPESERLSAQAKASEMFAEFLASADPKVVSRRHPFAFFVQEWGGLRVPKKNAPSPKSAPRSAPLPPLPKFTPRPTEPDDAKAG